MSASHKACYLCASRAAASIVDGIPVCSWCMRNHDLLPEPEPVREAQPEQTPGPLPAPVVWDNEPGLMLDEPYMYVPDTASLSIGGTPISSQNCQISHWTRRIPHTKDLIDEILDVVEEAYKIRSGPGMVIEMSPTNFSRFLLLAGVPAHLGMTEFPCYVPSIKEDTTVRSSKILDDDTIDIHW
jgi:hypothetical protein